MQLEMLEMLLDVQPDIFSEWFLFQMEYSTGSF